METHCVFFEAETGSLNIIQKIFSFKETFVNQSVNSLKIKQEHRYGMPLLPASSDVGLLQSASGKGTATGQVDQDFSWFSSAFPFNWDGRLFNDIISHMCLMTHLVVTSEVRVTVCPVFI
jgi:hypothetical protein